jgi:hypothetical protein
MDDISGLIEALAQYAPLWIAICVAFFSGIVLNYLGVRYFTTVTNGALFATGAILAAVLTKELLQEGGPRSTWTQTALLPLGIWAAGVLLTYLDRKLHLSTILDFLLGAIVFSGWVLILWMALLSATGRKLSFGETVVLPGQPLSLGETLVVLSISLVLVVLGGLLMVKINASKPMLILSCTVFGTVLIAYGLSNLPFLLATQPNEVLPIEALEVQLQCVTFPMDCLDMALNKGYTLHDLFPWARLEFLAIPITGIFVQWVILRRQRYTTLSVV